MKGRKNTDYRPVSCSFIDYVEHYATLRMEVSVCYTDAAGTKVCITTQIRTWILEDGVEYLVLATGLRVRMDHVVSVAEHVLADMDDHCSLS